MGRRAHAGVLLFPYAPMPDMTSAWRKTRTKCLLGLVALAIAVFPTRPSLADLDTASRDWDGLGDFVDIARQEVGAGQVVVTSRLDFAQLKKEDGIVVVHPERSLDTESLSRFMRDGGRVVLLDDYGTGDELLRHFGMERTPPPRDPREMLRHNPSLAIAVPATDPPHASVQGVTRVVTNHATGLRHPKLTPVLTVPEQDGDDVLVAVAGAVGQGRLLAVGDSSVVMNSMLRYPGNKGFARGLVRYATEDDAWGARGGRLYVVVGAFDETGAYGDAEEDTLGAKWRALGDWIEEVDKQGFSPPILLALAVLVGLGVVLWIGSRAGKMHKPVVPRYVQPIPLAAQGGIAGHAAVIAAPGTSRVLALLELKSALEEELALLAGMETTPGHDVLLRVVAEKQLLSREGLVELRALLLRLANMETLVLSRRAQMMKGVKDAEVLVVARAIRRVVHEARERAKNAA